MTDLTTDEQTILLIAARGERLIPIGHWKEPIEALVKRGLLVRERHPGDPTGHFNNVISPAGRTAVDQLETGYDKLMKGIIDMVSPQQMATMLTDSQKRDQTMLRAEAEQIAAQLAGLARTSAQKTGASEQIALKKWTRVITERAKEMVK
jgi:hypothetical protein